MLLRWGESRLQCAQSMLSGAERGVLTLHVEQVLLSCCLTVSNTIDFWLTLPCPFRKGFCPGGRVSPASRFMFDRMNTRLNEQRFCREAQSTSLSCALILPAAVDSSLAVLHFSALPPMFGFACRPLTATNILWAEHHHRIFSTPPSAA